MFNLSDSLHGAPQVFGYLPQSVRPPAIKPEAEIDNADLSRSEFREHLRHDLMRAELCLQRVHLSGDINHSWGLLRGE